jgi:hypothetical protein
MENFNLGYIHSKAKFFGVSKAFSICMKTAAIDMLLLKFKMTCTVSLVHKNVL